MSKSPKGSFGAIQLARQIEAKAEELLAPMDLEMKIKDWNPEFRKIMWEAIASKAAARVRTCR
jgi:hypothetical protein